MRISQRLLSFFILIWAVFAHADQLPQRAFVSSAHPLASEAGVQVLRQGGNAVMLPSRSPLLWLWLNLMVLVWAAVVSI